MLKYSVRGESIETTDTLRDYVQKRLDKLGKYFEINSDVIAHINLEVYSDHIAKAEVTIPLPHLVLCTGDTTNDTYKSIDFISKKLEHQIRRYKTRINRKNREKGLKDLFYEDLEEEKKTSKEPDIIRNKHSDLKPMNAEETVLQMDLLGHDFLVPEDADTNSTSIIYRRDDDRYGLIETNE